MRGEERFIIHAIYSIVKNEGCYASQLSAIVAKKL